MLRLIEDV